MRIGQGYDVHRFGSEKPLVLGGVEIPHDQGLIAHSDGDVVLHAVCDAILGALALGDIGTHFPDTDTAFENIDSKRLLEDVFFQCQQAGMRLGNLDVTIVAQAPKVNPFVLAMREAIAQVLRCALHQVNVKATTTEKLGFVGRKEGIACHAVVLLVN